MIINDADRKGQKKANSVRFVNLDNAEGIFLAGHKYQIKSKALNALGNILRIDIEPVAPEKAAPKKKAERMRHIKHPRTSLKALCMKRLSKNNRARGMRYPATCEKCIELQAQLPPPAPKVKKLRAWEAQQQMRFFINERRAAGIPEQELLTAFDTEVQAHPEWLGNHNRMEKARRSIKI